MKHISTAIAAGAVIVALIWLYFYAPCGVFYWNTARDIPARCHAELGRS
jgi:hypothetical protein